MEDLIKGIRVGYRSSIIYPDENAGAGRKGGRKRKARIYINQDQDKYAKRANHDAPFTEIWHNNEPLMVIAVKDIPIEKSSCGYCGREFPRGIIAIQPFDIALSHRERWQYLNRNTNGKDEPKYLPSPRGKMTLRYYCISDDCIFKRFPYFRSELLEVSGDITLKESHKNLLREQLRVTNI